MKTLTLGPLARRKIVLIFLLAILLPALVLGYLSLSAFSKRREAVRRLLESNLWISGESALRAVEAALLDHEESILDTVNFAVLTKPADDSGITMRQVQAGSAANSDGTTSPDGRLLGWVPGTRALIFTSDRSDTYDLYILHVSGTVPKVRLNRSSGRSERSIVSALAMTDPSVFPSTQERHPCASPPSI